MKEYYPVPTILGLIKDYHSRIIPDNKCSEALNVIFQGGSIKNRWGYGSFGSQLNGPIMAIVFYERLKTAAYDIIAFTTSDTYRYNQRTGDWEMITRSYSTGTVTSSSSAGTVTITDGDLSELASEVNLYIKFGDTDLNSDGTWYRVSYSSETELTVTSDITLPNETDTAYVLRVCWQGGEEDHHSCAFPYYDDGANWSDNILLVSNGLDSPQWWDGTGTMKLAQRNFTFEGTTTSGSTTITEIDSVSVGQMTIGDTISGDGIPDSATITEITSTTSITLTASATASGTVTLSCVGVAPNPAKHIAFFGSVGYEHTILANTKEGTSENAQTLEYSNAGNPFMWAGNYDDLLDSNDEILGIVALETRLVVYKRYNISILSPELNATDEDFFEIEENQKRNVGTTSIRTVKNIHNYHIFMGWDNIYIYDGINVTPIGNDIIKYMIGVMNRDAMPNSFAIDIDEESLYCLFVPVGDDQTNPNCCFCYNYYEKHWTIWKLTDEIKCYGFFIRDYSPAYVNWIVFTTGTLTESSYEIPVASTEDMEEGMAVFVYDPSADKIFESHESGLPSNTDTVKAKITAIGTDSITVSSAATLSGDVSLKVGWAWEDVSQRYRDLIVRANYNCYLLGDSTGNIYEFSEDFFTDDGTAFECSLVTADYQINDVKMNFRLLDLVIGYILQSEGTLRLRASVTFGGEWSEWIDIPMDGTGADVVGADYAEYICNFLLRGTQCRFEISNYDGETYTVPFELEGLTIGYLEAGDRR